MSTSKPGMLFVSSGSNGAFDDSNFKQYCCGHCIYKTSCRVDFCDHYQSKHNDKPVVYSSMTYECQKKWKSYMIERSYYRKKPEEKEDHRCENNKNDSEGERAEDQPEDTLEVDVEGYDEYCCAQCDYKTGCRTDFEAHYKTTHNYQSMVYCSRCQFEKKLQRYLIDHSDYCKHTKHVEVFQCPECKYETMSKQYLIVHFNRKHTAMFTCVDCPNEHQVALVQGNSQVKKFECPECPYVHTKKFHIRYHMLTEHNRKRFILKEKENNTEDYRCLVFYQN